VGKGTGERYLAHVKEALKDFHGVDYTGKTVNNQSETDISLKLQTIREIHDQGMEVLVVIHQDGLDESTAYAVEAALIDAYSGLTNQMGGHGSSIHGSRIIHLDNRPAIQANRTYKRLQPALTIQVDTSTKHGQLLNEIRERGSISINDPITFRYSVDVLNELFDKGYGAFMKAVAHVDEGQDVWMPKLDYFRKGIQHEGVKHWHNYFVTGKLNTLVEYPAPGFALHFDFPGSTSSKIWRPYVFAKFEDTDKINAYRFFGVFESKGVVKAKHFGLTLDINDDDPVMWFERIATEAPLPKLKI
jgi:hypothetical protein